MTDNTTPQTPNSTENAAGSASSIAEQARQAVDNTVTTVTSAVSDLDLDKTAESVIATANETLDKIRAAYKRNPALVLAIGSAALAVVGTIVTRRR